MIIQKENKIQRDFEEHYQAKFDVMQAELHNQFAMLQTERDNMRTEWDNCMNDKNKEIDSLKKRLQDTVRALDQANKPGSSNDIPVDAAAVTSTITKVKTETIPEDKDPKPPAARGPWRRWRRW